MESTLKHGWWRLSTTGVLLVLNKLLVMSIAWLFFLHLVLVGWDLQAEQEQIRQQSPFEINENYEPAPHDTPKGGIEK